MKIVRSFSVCAGCLDNSVHTQSPNNEAAHACTQNHWHFQSFLKPVLNWDSVAACAGGLDLHLNTKLGRNKRQNPQIQPQKKKKIKNLAMDTDSVFNICLCYLLHLH